jgi:hypothetical protein
MKRLLIAALVAGYSVCSSFGQGALIFSNLGSGANGSNIAVNQAPFFDVDGTTKLTGTSFSAQLYYGALGALENALVNTGAPIVNFNSGGFAGYFSAQPTVTLTGVAAIGATATVQFRAWDNRTGSTWETATIRGKSALLTTPALGDPLNAASLPVVSTLGSVTLAVPEPATIALGLFGAAGLLIRRRK